MESNKLVVAVTLNGNNYLLWSRLTKSALGGRGLWKYVEESEAPKTTTQDNNGNEIVVMDSEKWSQENQLVLSFLQSSLDAPILEAYSYCESAKELWDILKKVFGNVSNISRIFEVKRAINELTQEGTSFNQHFGKFRSLWAELDMLRPSTVDINILNERKEQDKVFSLLLTLSPAYKDMIKHILRADTLPSLEEVCAQIQKEEGSLGLFGGKGELVIANKGFYQSQGSHGHPKGNGQGFKKCEHCKKDGHTKEGCWILHPYLRPARNNNFKRAHYSTKDHAVGTSSQTKEEEFKSLSCHNNKCSIGFGEEIRP